MKQVSRLKLPIGVVPIPKMLEEKRAKQEKINSAESKNVEANEHAMDKREKPKAKKLVDTNLHQQVAHNEDEQGEGQGQGGEHGFNDFNQKENAPWMLRVKPGFQEIGELNRDEKLSE